MTITIIKTEDSLWNVIADGRIADHLCWDEMLGQVAALTLTGDTRYRMRRLDQPSDWWNAPKGLLPEGGLK